MRANDRTFALTLEPRLGAETLASFPFREREFAFGRKEETPGSYELFWYPQHPNEVFGCRAARTRCGPVVANPPKASLTLGVPPVLRAPFFRGVHELRAGAVRRPLVPMANPSSQVMSSS